MNTKPIAAVAGTGIVSTAAVLIFRPDSALAALIIFLITFIFVAVIRGMSKA